MIKRITMIEPTSERLHIFSRFELPRLGGVLLATLMRDRGFHATALFMKPRDILARDLADRPRGHLHHHRHGPGRLRDRRCPARPRHSRRLRRPARQLPPRGSPRARRLLHRGEGEQAFPLLVDALNGDGQPGRGAGPGLARRTA